MTTNIKDKQSNQYRELRDKLLEAEIDLKEQREHVAELRRQLPATEVGDDYIFQEGPDDLTKNEKSDFTEVRLSELFSPDKKDLIVVHLMFAPENQRACVMCSTWADAYNGVAKHLNDKVNFVVIAKAEISKLRDYAKKRNWNYLRLLSSYHNTFNQDFNVQISPERQLPAVSVFQREANGQICHFYTTEASLSETHHRGIDLFNPIWHFYDLLPNGREEWMPKYSY